MNPRAGLMQAVLDAPDDDTVRLVFADWMQDHGEETWAEFIRVQCEIAYMDGTEGDRLTVLARRERELWEAHHIQWCADLPKWSRGKVAFRRGFPTIVSCTPPQWISGRKLTRRAPIRALRLTKVAPTQLAALVATEHLAGVQALSIPADRSELPQVLEHFSGSACAAGLQVLDLPFRQYHPGSTTGDALARALAASKFTRLECLYLGCEEIGPDGVTALAQSPVLANVHKLELGDNPIGDAGARALAGSPHLANLTALGVGCCQISSDGVAALAGSPHLAKLTHLNLWSCELTAEGVEVLADSPYLTRLAALTFDGARLGLDGVRALAGSANMAHLTYLRLVNCHDIDSTLRILVESPHLSRLRTLQFAGGHLLPESLRCLAHSPGLPALESLTVTWSGPLETIADEVRRSPYRTRLRQLASPALSVERATAQEIGEHFDRFHGERLAQRI
jgi:uncharacterized protein (TIGR02996 family)